MHALTNEEIHKKLAALTGWSFLDNHITKEFHLDNFMDALDFVNRAGKKAEEMNHHPDILIHSYRTVKFMITTHDAGGVTEKDFELAGIIEKESGN